MIALLALRVLLAMLIMLVLLGGSSANVCSNVPYPARKPLPLKLLQRSPHT